MEMRILADYVMRLPNGEERGGNQNKVSLRITENDSVTYGGRAQEPLLPLAVIDASAHRVEAAVQDLYSDALRAELPAQNLKNDFIRTLQKIDAGVQRLDLVQTGQAATRLQIKHEKTGITPLSALGDGFRRALMIAVAIPTVRGGILLIDELETALHVSVLESALGLLKWAAEEFDVQVFATTHSLEAVDAVCRRFSNDLDEIVAFRISQFEKRAIAKRYPGKFMHDIRFERGFDIR
jgi:predicted ATP-dependent endonuclease of OLD family